MFSLRTILITALLGLLVVLGLILGYFLWAYLVPAHYRARLARPLYNFYIKIWFLHSSFISFRAYLVHRLEQSYLGVHFRRILRDHLGLWVTVGIYLCLGINYYRGLLDPIQVWSLAILHLLILRQLHYRFIPAHIPTLSSQLVDVYYISTMVFYLMLFLLLSFFFNDYYSFFLQIKLLHEAASAREAEETYNEWQKGKASGDIPR